MTCQLLDQFINGIDHYVLVRKQALRSFDRSFILLPAPEGSR